MLSHLERKQECLGEKHRRIMIAGGRYNKERTISPNAECVASLFQHKPSLFTDALRLSGCIEEWMTIGGTHPGRFVHLYVGEFLSSYFVAKMW
ncbi:MAG: hypothetical protein IJR02_08745 [Bacteroidaceae bacterium]|nr:hypothetical protein [Bacteroidaceae bacterium]